MKQAAGQLSITSFQVFVYTITALWKIVVTERDARLFQLALLLPVGGSANSTLSLVNCPSSSVQVLHSALLGFWTLSIA
jgi:hypothetical protein